MYVVRNAKKEIVGAWSDPQHSRQERVEYNNPALQAYVTRSAASRALLNAGLSTDDIAAMANRCGMYIDRDDAYGITAAHEAPQKPGHEYQPIESIELQLFLEGKPAPTPPVGYEFKWVGGAAKWRIVRLSDGYSMKEGIESAQAAEDYMSGAAA